MTTSSERDELRWLVEGLLDEQVPAAPAEVCRYTGPAAARPWPPAFFGACLATRSDVAARAEDR